MMTEVQKAVQKVMEKLRGAPWEGGYLFDDKTGDESDTYAYSATDICQTFEEIEAEFNLR